MIFSEYGVPETDAASEEPEDGKRKRGRARSGQARIPWTEKPPVFNAADVLRFGAVCAKTGPRVRTILLLWHVIILYEVVTDDGNESASAD